MTRYLPVAEAADLDSPAIAAIAAGAVPRVSAPVLAQVDRRRGEMLQALERSGPVYGVSTGMGAQGGVLLDAQAQAAYSERLLLGRCVGGPPWLDPPEVRALFAVRLRDFLTGDAGVSADLCRWLERLLEHDEALPSVPRDASASAGEIVPLAHAFAHLADPEPPDAVRRLDPPRLGVKEGVALMQGRPMATALALLRAAEARELLGQWELPIAAELSILAAPGGPYLPQVARGDLELAATLERLRGLRGPVGETRPSQLPVSLRVVGPVLAAAARATTAVQAAVSRSLGALTDSPAYLPSSGADFASTPGFHAVELSWALDGLRTALLHAAQNGAARLHRMLDPRVSGLPAQLADPPGGTGLVVLHKQIAGEVQALVGEPAALLRHSDTALGQEDVQSSAPAAAEQVRRTLEVSRRVAAAELLAVHQARVLGAVLPEPTPLTALLAPVTAVLPDATGDRPRGEDLAAVAALLSSGTVRPWCP